MFTSNCGSSAVAYWGGQFLTVQAADTQIDGKQINDSKYYTNGSDLHTDTSTTTDQNVKTLHYAIAVGENTVATGTDAIAAGTHNTASGKWSVAWRDVCSKDCKEGY